MSLAVCEVTAYWTDTVPRDRVVNTLHFANGSPDPINDTDYGDIASTVADAFHSFFTSIGTGSVPKRGYETRVYELDDTKPRVPRATHTIAPTGAEDSDSLGPRQVASVLSYYSGDSALAARKRGRLYLGPFAKSLLGSRVPTDITSQAHNLATAFGSAGGDNVQWVTFSRVGGGHDTVAHWWMDDRWDTIRRRGLKPLSRVTGTSGG